MNVEQNFVLLSIHKQTEFNKLAPVFICSFFYNRCNIPNPSTATQSISDKEIEEVIPAKLFRTDRSFDFPFCPLFIERVLSIEKRAVTVVHGCS